MEESITIVVDCYGEWIEKNNRFIWRWKDGDISESILMIVQRDILYDDFVNSIISYCGLNCQPNDLVISYMHKSFENQRVLPFKIGNQLRLRAYLNDEIEHDVDEDQTPTPIVDIGGSSQLKQLNNLYDDETGFYIGMTFKNKEELVTSLLA
ncbi:hypothetical protein H5410_026582 [Solanum commersonii]|uniref:Uncharacterized protein n=1 Tax=Solanum commersonii TaxID=4109 RepID=A0A9J5YXF6_SOLCO|nr:hypothetical protein H5410_026582 [Solanum commersonii]